MANAKPISRPSRAVHCQTPVVLCGRLDNEAAPEGSSLGFPNGCSHEEQQSSLEGAARAGDVPAGGGVVGGVYVGGDANDSAPRPTDNRGSRRAADSSVRAAPLSATLKVSRRAAWVYALVDPRTKHIHYVGRTVNLTVRRNAHLARICGNSEMCEWRAGLRDAGLEPTFRVLARTTVERVAEAEKRWILRGRRERWPLVNKNLGGGGMVRRRPL